jgi:hypothetical protein
MDEKKEIGIGIIPAKKMKRKKNISPAREFWQPLVKILFDFCEDKFGDKPSFDGSAPKDMGLIIDAIKTKCDEKNIAWTEEMAKRSWLLFLQTCYDDKWLHDNFLLLNLNRQKDKIFFKLKSIQKNGTSKEQFTREGVMDEISRRYNK